ncbi:MAG: TIGR01777 family oxidoreductase [Sporichthyaceae bacterium]
MKVALTGASGLLGPHLIRSLRDDGHEVLRLVRRVPTAADEVQWDPDTGEVDLAALTGVDAVIHLAGANIGGRPWTPAYRHTVLDSRVSGTRTIASALARLDPRPRVLLSASGVGYYGGHGDEILDETSPTGDGYIAHVAARWEAETATAAAAGVRVVTMRTGVVVSGRGGALGRLIPLFRLGLGGRLGSGRQWWSWIGLHDYVRAVRFLLDRDDISGPVNVCAPEPVTNSEFTKTLARAVHRPAFLAVPGVLLQLPLRDFAKDLLAGQRVVPARLLEAGFRFDHPDLASALHAEFASR